MSDPILKEVPEARICLAGTVAYDVRSSNAVSVSCQVQSLRISEDLISLGISPVRHYE